MKFYIILQLLGLLITLTSVDADLNAATDILTEKQHNPFESVRRILKRSSSRRSSSGSSGRSSSSSSSSGKKTTRKTTKRTTTKKTYKKKTSTSNSYWNAGNMRTYSALTAGVYFRPIGIYLVYVSPYYGTTYYDGYGWNFYTQSGGYYDCKRNIIFSEAPPGCDVVRKRVYISDEAAAAGAGLIVAIVGGIIFLCVLGCVLRWLQRRCVEVVEDLEDAIDGSEHEEEEEVVEEEVVEEVVVVVEEKVEEDTTPAPYQQPPPPGYPPAQYPPAYPQMPPAGYPPGQMPPGYPPGQMPPAQYPPGQMPPAYPPGQMPPAYPPGQAPPAQYPGYPQ